MATVLEWLSDGCDERDGERVGTEVMILGLRGLEGLFCDCATRQGM